MEVRQPTEEEGLPTLPDGRNGVQTSVMAIYQQGATDRDGCPTDRRTKSYTKVTQPAGRARTIEYRMYSIQSRTGQARATTQDRPAAGTPRTGPTGQRTDSQHPRSRRSAKQTEPQVTALNQGWELPIRRGVLQQYEGPSIYLGRPSLCTPGRALRLLVLDPPHPLRPGTLR